jgi:hypothetical protein
MTPAQLTAIGESLYGPQWVTALARDIGRNRKTVQDWKRGKYRISESAEWAIREAVKARQKQLNEIGGSHG